MELEKCLCLVIPVFRRKLRISVTVLYIYHNIVIIHLITRNNVIQVAERLLIVDQLIDAIAITSPHLHTHTLEHGRDTRTHTGGSRRVVSSVAAAPAAPDPQPTPEPRQPSAHSPSQANNGY